MTRIPPLPAPATRELTVLVGPTGVGKTNLVEILEKENARDRQ